MCPRCGHEYVCGCNSCKDRTRGKLRWQFVDGDWEECGRCGLTAHVDQWFDEFYAQHREHEHKPEYAPVRLSRWWRIPLVSRQADRVKGDQ